MKLNADLGESFGHWQSSSDEDLMPFIDQANLACGYHAGDPKVLERTISIVKKHKVSLGAHPSYPDLQGFGRRSMRIPAAELIPMLHAQIAVVEGMAKCQGVALQYIKPHGALYNDMMQHAQVFEDVLAALTSYHQRYPLMIQALANNDFHQQLADQQGVSLIYEAFADRRYTSTGYLASRQVAGAVLAPHEALEQARRLIEKHQVISDQGKTITIQADSLCVHGDTPSALQMAIKIRDMLGERRD
jgi:UPF0271 protein